MAGSLPPPKGKTGVARILAAAGYSIDGLRAAFQHEASFRQEVVLAAILTIVAILVPASPTQTAMLLSSILLVLIVELVNSAVEATVDRISGDHHELAKRAKDIASAAVLISLVNCVVVWVLVLTAIVGRDPV